MARIEKSTVVLSHYHAHRLKQSVHQPIELHQGCSTHSLLPLQPVLRAAISPLSLVPVAVEVVAVGPSQFVEAAELDSQHCCWGVGVEGSRQVDQLHQSHQADLHRE